MFSIGIMILHSLECASARYSMAAVHPADKIAFILSWDGPFLNNILLIMIGTSVTVGLFTNIQYLQNIFFLFAICLTTILLFALLFLTACLYRYEKREAQGIKWYQCFVRGDHAFSNKCVSNFDEASAEVLHEKLTEIHPSLTGNLAKLTTCKKSKYYVFMLVVILIFAIYGCFTFRINLSGEHFIKINSN
uniref:Uncharacterized protein n=1 Tax=Acrobeloides nanus TaxID=290746 RepID=A0A914ELB8_9BILA